MLFSPRSILSLAGRVALALLVSLGITFTTLFVLIVLAIVINEFVVFLSTGTIGTVREPVELL